MYTIAKVPWYWHVFIAIMVILFLHTNHGNAKIRIIKISNTTVPSQTADDSGPDLHRIRAEVSSSGADPVVCCLDWSGM